MPIEPIDTPSSDQGVRPKFNHRFNRLGDRIGFVYFVEASTFERVKIGYAKKDPLFRLMHLQIGCPFWLDLIAVVEGLENKENHIHEFLKPYSLEGEWYLARDLVLRTIEAATKVMTPGDAEWCRGGDKYAEWDRQRKQGCRTPESVESHLGDMRERGYVPEDPAEVISSDYDPNKGLLNGKIFEVPERYTMAYWHRYLKDIGFGLGGESREPIVSKASPDVDRHRAEKRAAKRAAKLKNA